MQNSLLTKVKAFLLLLGGNPIIQWLLKTGQSAAVGYIGTAPFAPSKAWAIGLATAVAYGIVHASDIWLAQQTGNGVLPQATTSSTSHFGQLKAMLKMVALLIGASLIFASAASAGYLISGNKAERVGLALPSGTDLYLMPIEGFDVGAALPKPTYGMSLNEDLVLGQLSTVNGATNLSPILGLGASLYLDGAGVVNGNGPLLLSGGINAVGPDLDLLGLGNGQGLVPHVLLVKNFVTGETTWTGGLTVFTDLGPGTAQKIAGQ